MVTPATHALMGVTDMMKYVNPLVLKELYKTKGQRGHFVSQKATCRCDIQIDVFSEQSALCDA